MQWKSLPDMLRQSCATWPQKSAMLTPGKDGFQAVSYAELWKLVRAYAGALQALGLVRGDRLAIQADNCMEWSLVDWAARGLGIVVIPIYPTLPADQTQFIVSDCEAKAVVAGNAEQATKSKDEAQVALLMDIDADSRANPDRLTEEQWNAEVDRAELDDISTFIYTSGTTGNPKGAMLSHRAFLHVCHFAKQEIPFEGLDTFLTFLPMSHVFERVAGQALPLSFGGTIAYAKNLMTLGSDMMATTPSVMLVVPRFLEATMDKILDGVKKQPPLRQKLFHLCIEQATRKSEGKFAPLAGILDKIVGTKIRARTGGRLRFFVSGGAALPPHVAKFYAAIGLPVLQGYGLTETTGGTCINRPDNNKYWTVGEPLGMDIKIAQDGEILIKGPALMAGYYNLPEATAQAIDADGWFHTGDIGEFEGKSLKITDRKKDILVLANGKNIAPQPIENRIKESHLIKEAVLFGDGSEYVYALILPNFEDLEMEMAADGVKAGDPAATIQLESVKARLKAELDKVNKTLADFEKVKKHALISEAFSVENGELTPSHKVRRKVVKEKYADLLSTLTR